MEGYGNENPGAFQPTRPLRGATAKRSEPTRCSIFQSTRPLRGATSQPITKVELLGEFQPTRPLRGATYAILRETKGIAHFNPRAPCGARPTLHEALPARPHFNPRAPCGARRGGRVPYDQYFIFQPTRPLRGATNQPTQAGVDHSAFQPTRPLRGATK